MLSGDDLLALCLERGESVLAQYPLAERRQNGQYLTPIPVARYMARQLDKLADDARILDPAVGSGILLCAVVERCVHERTPTRLKLVGCDNDPRLLEQAAYCLDMARSFAGSHGLRVEYELVQGDFTKQAVGPPSRGTGMGEPGKSLGRFDGIVANPPYVRLGAAQHQGSNGVTYANLYAMFMSLCSRMLVPAGEACFLVPRSFCSGTRYDALRRELLGLVTPRRVHVFESRHSLFRKDSVLQENILFCGSGGASAVPESVLITSSLGQADLDTAKTQVLVPFEAFTGGHNGELYFRLPLDDDDLIHVNAVENWRGSLSAYGLRASTGRVVPFRSTAMLSDPQWTAGDIDTAPLIWLHSVMPQRISWPLPRGGKPQWLEVSDDSRRLLVPRGNYVLVRRFSAKEESRRLVAAPMLAEEWNHRWIGIENHVNYIYGGGLELSSAEAIGIAAVLNSTYYDRYLRILSGNTQVNASDLRALPLPPLDKIRDLGIRLREHPTYDLRDLDRVVGGVLGGPG